MFEQNQSRKNESGNASDARQTSYAEFVKRHQSTLNYLLKFGNAVERAKAETLLELARG